MTETTAAAATTTAGVTVGEEPYATQTRADARTREGNRTATRRDNQIGDIATSIGSALRRLGEIPTNPTGICHANPATLAALAAEWWQAKHAGQAPLARLAYRAYGFGVAAPLTAALYAAAWLTQRPLRLFGAAAITALAVVLH